MARFGRAQPHAPLVLGPLPVVYRVANATLASTLDALTLSGTGQVPVNASLASTFGALTLTGTGTIPVNASLNSTLSALTLAGLGTIPINASLGTTLAALSLLGSAQVPINASLNITFSALTLAGIEAGPSFNATLSVTLDALTLTGTATVSGATSFTGSGIDYWTIKQAIKTILDTQLSSLTPRPLVAVEQTFPSVPRESWIGVYQDGREAPEDIQVMSAGTKVRLRVRHVLWVWRYAMEQDKAIQLRNSLLGQVEIALMLDRTLGGLVETAWLEGGRLVTADDPSKSGRFFAGAELVLTAQAAARST